jgi:nitroreductase
MDGSVATLLLAAGRAPSGDNTQPWRFVVDPGARTIALEDDPSRDASPMNAGRRMSRIAVGAALENLIRKARSHGWGVELEQAASPGLAMVRLIEGGAKANATEDVEVPRLTNRRNFDGRPLPAEILDRLIEQAPDLGGVRTHWIVGAERLVKLAQLVGRADATMFGEASMRRAFLSKIRLDAAPGEVVAEGLSPSSLELSAFDRLALRTIKRAPDRLLNLVGVSRAFATKARKLVGSSSGLCLVVARDDSEATDLLVGRAMQGAWLALTAEGLAVQPMMSLVVLENVYEHGAPALVESLGRGRLAALRDRFRALAPEIGTWRPAFLMRFGFAPAPSGRTGRLPLQAVAVYSTSSPGPAPVHGKSLAPSGLEGAA